MTEDIRWEPQQDSSHYRFCIAFLWFIVGADIIRPREAKRLPYTLF